MRAFCGFCSQHSFLSKGEIEDMQIASFDATLQLLEKLDPWLVSLGIQPKNDRWHEALKIVRRAREQRQLIDRGGQREFIDNYISGLFDATEIHEIVRAFAGDTSPALKEKMQRALSGPIAPLSEQPKNSVARNAMFELSLAADWKNGGADVQLGEPDIILRLTEALFHVECKRPFYESTVWPNIDEAAHQVAKELNKTGNEKAFGIVAISLSRVFTQGDLVCFADQDEGREFVNATLQSLIDEHREEWGLDGSKEFHEQIVAVMFHLAVPWDMNGERLIHTAMSNFVKVGKCAEGWETLSQNLPSLY